MTEDDGQGGLENGVMECMRQVWRTNVDERTKIHYERLKEAMDYKSRYLADCDKYGLDHIRHYYNSNTGEFFYEVSDEPSDLQRFIDDNLGIR